MMPRCLSAVHPIQLYSLPGGSGSGRRRARHDAQATQPVERLRHLVDLIVVLAVREAATLIAERFDPWRQGRVREVQRCHSTCGLIACARATLPPSGVTGTSPGIWWRSAWITAGPLALVGVGDTT